MEKISVLLTGLFILTTFFTVWQFFIASRRSKPVLIILVIWLALQAIAGAAGFYRNYDAFPPRFILLIAPGFIAAILLLLTSKGKRFLDSLDKKSLTILHVARIPVEISLYAVCVAGLIPEAMTFEGNNFDILSGISAPLVYALVFIVKKAGKKTLLAWNIACTLLLINVLVIAILSAPTPFQQMAFDQPNVGVGYFPFVWLPAVIVPLVLISHLAAIRQLVTELSPVKQPSTISA